MKDRQHVEHSSSGAVKYFAQFMNVSFRDAKTQYGPNRGDAKSGQPNNSCPAFPYNCDRMEPYGSHAGLRGGASRAADFALCDPD